MFVTNTGRRTTFVHGTLLGRLLIIVSLVGIGLAPAASALAGPSWTPGPDAVEDAASDFQGFIDAPLAGATLATNQAFHLTGWVVDNTAQGWAGIDEVHAYVGLAGQGTFLGNASVGLNRPDVASALGNGFWAMSGFDLTVGPGALPAGPATLSVYAHSPSKGWWLQQVQVQGSGAAAGAVSGSTINLTVLAPSVNEVVPVSSEYVIRGTAFDTSTTANTGVGVDRVDVYLDGLRGVAGSQFLGEAYPDASTDWSVPFSPTHYDHVQHHVLFVYARSAVSGLERLVTVEFFITNHTLS
jgi:hypothetical protein